ncbi:MAG TPA: ferredoxin family protein [Kiritimatiellia bacterium]|nr:ferredoxin family protein [Kiritimatiellia bacterium]HOM58309.1 ferredoxin family protein [Kiritimatiellia bacterium]HOR97790.1 ferredoxin family protein [Kiritimatiellia bacterium]HPC49072.1 ferredoxin family protein [Kiritimatiellia bacterium]HPK37053.1 ferredoxin family protein [Kiritimatiellia bacterium]
MATVMLIFLGARDRLLADGVATLAAHAGVPPETVVQLTDLAEQALPRGREQIRARFRGEEPLVIGCSRPRAVRALLDFAGVDTTARPIEWVALPFDREALRRESGVPWYPVIDRTLCTGCGTCREYCLFSVYGRTPGEQGVGPVRVVEPLYCKTGCPACARLCPVGALIFPFCPEAELNGEIETPAPQSNADLKRQLGEDPLRLLTERRKRRGLLDLSKFEQAEEDRIRHSGVL